VSAALTSSSLPNHLRRGATLVEVMVAVAILSMTLVPLIGMLSMAVDTSGKAVGLTVSARIAEQLMGEVQQADWATLDNWNDMDVYFDDQGLRLASGVSPNLSVYSARVKLSPAGVTLTTANSAGPGANTWTRQVVLLVASAPGSQGKSLLDTASNALQAKKSLPQKVYLSRALLTNLEKPPAS
jgi:uncharacterized protein (TIGR02598 family)